MSVILMTSLFYKALILQAEIFCWSLLGLKGLSDTRLISNKTPKVVSVGCVGLWKHNGVLSEFKKIREITGKMCHVMSIDDELV